MYAVCDVICSLVSITHMTTLRTLVQTIFFFKESQWSQYTTSDCHQDCCNFDHMSDLCAFFLLSHCNHKFKE
jgi:hypothetical protein